MLLILIVNLIIKIKSLLAVSAKPSQQGSGSIPLQKTCWYAVRNKCLGAEFRAAPFYFCQDNLSFLLQRRRERQAAPASFESRLGSAELQELLRGLCAQKEDSVRGSRVPLGCTCSSWTARYLSVLSDVLCAPLRACWSQ